MKDKLKPRDLENDPPPDFKKLKVALWLSAILSGLVTLVMIVAVIALFHENLGGNGIALGLPALRGLQAFYIYRTLRGIKFVSTYQDVEPDIVF